MIKHILPSGLYKNYPDKLAPSSLLGCKEEKIPGRMKWKVTINKIDTQLDKQLNQL